MGALNYNPTKERTGSVPIKESVAAIKELIDSGKTILQNPNH